MRQMGAAVCAPIMDGGQLIGFIILVVGLAMAAYLLDVPGKWIAVGVVVALGVGVVTATSRTKMKPSARR